MFLAVLVVVGAVCTHDGRLFKNACYAKCHNCARYWPCNPPGPLPPRCVMGAWSTPHIIAHTDDARSIIAWTMNAAHRQAAHMRPNSRL